MTLALFDDVVIRLDGQSISLLTLNEGIYQRLAAGKHAFAVDPPIGQLPWSFPAGITNL